MNVIRRQTPAGYSVFCDDVRIEQGSGKHIYIGVYLGQMLFNAQSFPTRLSTFNVVTFYQERKDESTHPVSINVFIPAQEEPAFTINLPRDEFAKMELPPTLDDPLVQVAVVAQFRDLVIREAGLIRVRAFRGEEEIHLGALEVRLNPSSAAPKSDDPNSSPDPS